MGFWKKVDEELAYLGMSRKELAQKANFDVSYISKGIERDGIPIADTALRIARVLQVSLDYLLGMEESENGKNNASPQPLALQKEDIRKFRAYKSVIDQLEHIGQKEKKPLLQLIETLAECNCPSPTPEAQSPRDPRSLP